MLKLVNEFQLDESSGDRDSVFERRESRVRSYSRHFPVVFDRASGCEVWDSEGNRYLDFLSSAGALNYGHNHPVLKQALLDYLARDGIDSSLDLHTDAKCSFLETFETLILKPRHLDHVVQFTGPTGTNAIEASLKIARKVTGRTNVIAFTNGFHGMTMGALAATANRYHRQGAGMPLSGITRMPYDGYLGQGIDTTDYLRKVLSDASSGVDLPAAILVETVQGEGGLRAAGREWLQSIERICREIDALLICDDIQSGSGRTGKFFGFEHAGIEPDIVTLSKSISGNGQPMALVLLRREFDQWKPGEHNGTFRGNNHAFVTATAALQNFWTNSRFEQQIKRKAMFLSERLDDLVDSHPDRIIEIRGRGLMQGLCFADPADAELVTQTAFQKGLIAERVGSRDEVVKCMMPLTISDDQLAEGLDILKDSISATARI